MNWTKEKPTAPGWYWVRENPGNFGAFATIPKPVRVIWTDDRGWLCDGWQLDVWCKRFPGEFAGPIPEPEARNRDAKLIDALTNMIDENIRKGRCGTYDEWQAEVERVLRS